jgi:endoglycosylceramidase
MQFVDEHGRTRVFHGVNAVYKLPPYIPSDGAFDSTTTLDEKDFQLLQGWGMNFVRLGVLWEAVEPTKGQYNVTYLDEVVKMVRAGAKYGVYFVIDAH